MLMKKLLYIEQIQWHKTIHLVFCVQTAFSSAIFVQILRDTAPLAPKYGPPASLLVQGEQIFYKTVLTHRAAQIRLANMAVNGR